jgi:hypothetical protein
MNDSSKPLTLELYYQRATQRVRDLAPRWLAMLRSASVATVRIDYDGGCDSGCIESMVFLNQAGKEMATPTFDLPEQDFEQFFYDLLEVRHTGWKEDDGAYGSFEWDVANDVLAHRHLARYIDTECTDYTGLP